MPEPLSHFYSKFGFDPGSVNHLVCGEYYVGLMLNTGEIGVCSRLRSKVDLDIQDLNPIDLENMSHRIVLTAYYNAQLNYSNDFSGASDIFDKINFEKYRNIVMIGYFQSLLKKFQNKNIELTVFDNTVNKPEVADSEKQKFAVENAEAIILTGTSIFNNTFYEIMSWTESGSDIFVLGPSTILHPDMFQYGNISVLFGALFNENDMNLLSLIEQGKGTRDFLPYMKKVYLNSTL
jgi:uncharacterized protein (DUF4213/DUF364 family)